MRCNRVLLAIISVIVTAFIGIGCQGPQGPAGRDAIVPDSQAPVVDWVYPFGGAVLTNIDTLLVNVTDNNTIDSVSFIVNGRILTNGLVRISTVGNMYRARWDTRVVNPGQYTLEVRALDHAGNVGMSSPINILIENIQSGLDSLQNFASYPDVIGWRLPDVDHTSMYAVQLTPVQTCSLAAIRFQWLPDRAGQTTTDTLVYYLIAPDSLTGYPGAILDSMVILPDTLPHQLRTAVVHGYRWAAGQTRFIGIGVANPATNNSIQITTDVYPYQFRDWYYIPTSGWSRIPAGPTDPHNLMIGAIVYY